MKLVRLCLNTINTNTSKIYSPVMLFRTIVFILFSFTVATPPACFISCANEVSHGCPRGPVDLLCLCANETPLLSCFIDICPLGTFFSARDHYFGTCLEHGKPRSAFMETPTSSAMPVSLSSLSVPTSKVAENIPNVNKTLNFSHYSDLLPGSRESGIPRSRKHLISKIKSHRPPHQD